MNSSIKIPTLLGLGLLLVGIILGVFSVTANQTFQSLASPTSAPKDILVSNFSSTSASIYWVTDNQIPGFVSSGESLSLGQTFLDDRDSSSPQSRKLHFVTLTNLKPNTTYYYKIASGSTFYPIGDPLTFKTTPSIPALEYQPLIGSVADSNLKPVDESFIKLEIGGAQVLTTITKLNGSFILPLANIKNQKLDSQFILKNGTAAKLVITDSTTTSTINLKIPLADAILPPITLGKDLDLTVPTPQPVLGSSTTFNLNQMKIYDLNLDQEVDALDLSVILNNLDQRVYNSKYDLNLDQKVNLEDIQTLNQFIFQNSSEPSQINQ